MILKIMEGISSKDTFHVAKIAVDLSIFSQLPFFNNYFLKLLQKLKNPEKKSKFNIRAISLKYIFLKKILD